MQDLDSFIVSYLLCSYMHRLHASLEERNRFMVFLRMKVPFGLGVNMLILKGELNYPMNGGTSLGGMAIAI
jgi:hypothetical protein